MFTWKEEYSCNISEIDKQHKKLLSIGSELYDLVRLRDGLDHYDEIMKILTELADYTVYHFNYEEELLIQYQYENLKAHQLEHRAFVNKIKQIQNQDIDDKQSKVTMDIMVFIADWIEKHILGTDQKYVKYLNNQGVS